MNEARVVPTRSISALSRRNLNAGGTVQPLRIEDNPRSVPNIQEPVRRANRCRVEPAARNEPAPSADAVSDNCHRPSQQNNFCYVEHQKMLYIGADGVNC